jgi:hypothetical protein
MIPDARESDMWPGEKVVPRPKVPAPDAVTFGECCFAASKNFYREP